MAVRDWFSSLDYHEPDNPEFAAFKIVEHDPGTGGIDEAFSMERVRTGIRQSFSTTDFSSRVGRNCIQCPA